MNWQQLLKQFIVVFIFLIRYFLFQNVKSISSNKLITSHDFVLYLQRQRASTLTPGQELSHGTTSRLLPTVFKWEGGGKDVYVTGTFNNWKSKIPLARRYISHLLVFMLGLFVPEYMVNAVKLETKSNLRRHRQNSPKRIIKDAFD